MHWKSVNLKKKSRVFDCSNTFFVKEHVLKLQYFRGANKKVQGFKVTFFVEIKPRARNLWLLFSLFLLLSIRQIFKWKHHYLSRNITIFYSNDDLFTQLFLMTFHDNWKAKEWEREEKVTKNSTPRGQKKSKSRLASRRFSRNTKGRIWFACREEYRSKLNKFVHLFFGRS